VSSMPDDIEAAPVSGTRCWGRRSVVASFCGFRISGCPFLAAKRLCLVLDVRNWFRPIHLHCDDNDST
jgi:hypothetical protein